MLAILFLVDNIFSSSGKTPTMKYKAVIFDMDGTLLNTLADISDSMNSVLLERGYPTHSEESYKLFIGDGMGTLVRRALPSDVICDDIVASCIEDMADRYDKNWDINSFIYDGVSELLTTIEKNGVKKAILTNKPNLFVKRIYDKYFSKWKFEVMLGSTKSYPRKPDPTTALMIADKLSLHPSEIVFLGDSSVDMITAVNAKMYPVGALWGYRTREELFKSGASTTIEEPTELLAYL